MSVIRDFNFSISDVGVYRLDFVLNCREIILFYIKKKSIFHYYFYVYIGYREIISEDHNWDFWQMTTYFGSSLFFYYDDGRSFAILLNTVGEQY